MLVFFIMQAYSTQKPGTLKVTSSLLDRTLSVSSFHLAALYRRCSCYKSSWQNSSFDSETLVVCPFYLLI